MSEATYFRPGYTHGVPATGPDSLKHVRLAFVGEAPGRTEVAQGRPFVGASGRTLRKALSHVGIRIEGCFVTNVSHLPFEHNDETSSAAQELIRKQTPYLLEELRHVPKLRVVVALGATAAQAFGIDTPIGKARGSVYEHPSLPGVAIIPTWHPAFLLRARFEKTGDDALDKLVIWEHDFDKALKLAQNGYTPPQEDFHVVDTITKFRRMLDDLRSPNEPASLLAVDLETSSLAPTPDGIVCIGIAPTAERAYTIPLGHPSVRWTTDERHEIKLGLGELFSRHRLLFQNAAFDLAWLQMHFQIGQDMDRIEDTMLLHHILDPEFKHDLGFIVSLYGTTPYWKEEFLTRDTTVRAMDPETLFTYNMRDCVVLHQIFPVMLDELNDGTRLAYREEVNLIPVVHEMEATGVLVDPQSVVSFSSELDRTHDTLEIRLRELGRLPPGFSLTSNDDLALFLFGYQSRKYLKVDTLDKKRPGTKVHAELSRLKNVVENTQQLWKGASAPGRGSSGKVTVDSGARRQLVNQIAKRLGYLMKSVTQNEIKAAEIESLKTLLEWLSLYEEWKGTEKMRTTYTDLPVKQDGRLHAGYMIHGTVTGRFASHRPNMQNFPKKDLRIRRAFVAPPGKVIVSADYSNLEVRVLAYESQDAPLIEMLEQGVNIHDENTKILFGIGPDNEMWSLARRAAKIFQFGSLSYGGGDTTIHRKITIEVPELGLTLEDFRKAKQRYMDAHPGYRAWRERVIALAESERIARSSLGRERTLYGDSYRNAKIALNFPCQAGAASIINRAASRILKNRFSLGFALQAQVHDQLIFEVAVQDVAPTVELIRHYMEAPVQFGERWVAFPVDVETGPSWGELKAYEESTT